MGELSEEERKERLEKMTLADCLFLYSYGFNVNIENGKVASILEFKYQG